MILTHKTECFPTPSQEGLFEKCFGMRRFYFNKTIMTLRHKHGDLKENRKLITKKEVMSYRRDVFRDHYYELVRSVPSHILDTAIEDVMFALNSLWKKGREITLRKKKASNTFRFCKSGANPFRYTNGEKCITLPTVKTLKMAEPLRWDDADIRTVTIKRTAGRYFICITCEVPDLPRYQNRNRHVAIDWGIKTYITAFDGTDVLVGDFDQAKLDRLDKRVASYQKALARKTRFSKNWHKAKTKLEQAYLNFVNYRHTEVKDMVKYIDEHYDSVTLENLGMRFVSSNRRLARRAAQKPFYLLKATLINKLAQTGKSVFLVPKGYPSTQTCNSCGNVKVGVEKLKLGDKVYECKVCGHTDDRDVNAAKNLWSYKNLEVATLEE